MYKFRERERERALYTYFSILYPLSLSLLILSTPQLGNPQYLIVNYMSTMSSAYFDYFHYFPCPKYIPLHVSKEQLLYQSQLLTKLRLLISRPLTSVRLKSYILTDLKGFFLWDGGRYAIVVHISWKAQTKTEAPLSNIGVPNTSSTALHQTTWSTS